MTGVWEFPQLTELRSYIIDVTEAALNEAQSRDNRVDDLDLVKAFVIGEWGRGTAEVGQDPLELVLVFDFRTQLPEPSSDPGFDENAEIAVQTAQNILNSGDIEPPEDFNEWFLGGEIIFAPSDAESDLVSAELGSGEGNTIYELLRREQFVLQDGNVNRRPLNEIRIEPEEEEPEEEEPLEGEFGVEGPGDLQPGRPERRRDVQLLATREQFRTGPNQLSVPVSDGVKRVEDREPYEFEVRMGIPVLTLNQLEGFTSADSIEGAVGRFSPGLGTTVAPATFPRTGQYVKNRLLFQGPAYILELYNDLVFYAAFISSFYDMAFKPGTYPSFRTFMYRLKEVGERGGPELIRSLSQQQAAARGLETKADHPTIEGEKAPWLEKREYHQIVEENSDHEAWEDVTEFIYEELGTKEEVENQ